MRQVFALVTEDYVQYALVDDDSGELTQFAQIKTPVQFNLAEAALLGSNLIEALGLNSAKPKRGRPPKSDSPAQAQAAVAAKRKADPVAEVKKLGTAPHGYKKDGTPRKKRGETRRPENVDRQHISLEQVVAIIDQHPEGLTTKEIAAIIDPTDTAPRTENWTFRSIDNRITAAQTALEKKGTPLPFRTERKPGPRGTSRVLFPLHGESSSGETSQGEVETEATESETAPTLYSEGPFPWQQQPSSS